MKARGLITISYMDSMDTLGLWDSSLGRIPYLGVVRMGTASYICKNPNGSLQPPWFTYLITASNGNYRAKYKDGSYVLTGEFNDADYQLVAQDGEKGDTGEAGLNAPTIISVTTEYAISDSSTIAPTTGWSVILAYRENKKVWTRTKTILSDLTIKYSDPLLDEFASRLGSRTTYIGNDGIYTGELVADLVIIGNNLTVANAFTVLNGKIVIGEDVLLTWDSFSGDPKADLKTATDAAKASANAASGSANTASSAATTASTAASTATLKATAASDSATSAALSASTASNKADNANTSATNAANSASTASTKASEASTSATNASSSASSAATSANTATTKANAAASSASLASSSATAASTSESNAKTSETNAGNSATFASTSATNAATSEKNAKDYRDAAEGFKNTASTKADEAKAARDKALEYSNNAATTAASTAEGYLANNLATKIKADLDSRGVMLTTTKISKDLITSGLITADMMAAGTLAAGNITAGTLSALVGLAAEKGTIGGWDINSSSLNKSIDVVEGGGYHEEQSHTTTYKTYLGNLQDLFGTSVQGIYLNKSWPEHKSYYGESIEAGFESIIISSYQGIIGKSSDTSDCTFQFSPNGSGLIANKIRWYSNGEVYLDIVSGTYTGSWSKSSDARLKNNVKTLEDRGTFRPVSYEMNGRKEIGFIALEVKEIYPELVVEDTSENKYLSLDYPLLTAALAALINTLINKVLKLEEEIEELKKKL